MEDSNDMLVSMVMMEGLHLGPLFDFLSKNVPETLSTLQSKADKYIAVEELVEAKCRRQGKDNQNRKELDSQRSNYRGELKSKRFERDVRR